jgi:hypothetical protein
MHRYHKVIQKKLASFLQGSVIEYRFPSIRRIADVVFFPKKIIFEVQCSPISIENIQKRNRDYSSLGFTVIWILHDRIYNKKIATPAELYLRQNLSYYTSMTPFGHGFFYDQLDFFKGVTRIYKSTPQTIKSFYPKPPPRLPFFFPNKLRKRPLMLSGDTTEHLLKSKQGRWAWKLEKSLTKKWTCKKITKELFHSLLLKNASASHKYLEKQNTI